MLQHRVTQPVLPAACQRRMAPRVAAMPAQLALGLRAGVASRPSTLPVVQQRVAVAQQARQAPARQRLTVCAFAATGALAPSGDQPAVPPALFIKKVAGLGIIFLGAS